MIVVIGFHDCYNKSLICDLVVLAIQEYIKQSSYPARE